MSLKIKKHNILYIEGDPKNGSPFFIEKEIHSTPYFSASPPYIYNLSKRQLFLSDG